MFKSAKQKRLEKEERNMELNRYVDEKLQGKIRHDALIPDYVSEGKQKKLLREASRIHHKTESNCCLIL